MRSGNPLSDMQHHHPAAQRSGTAAPGKRNTINMEAYQAYYNTNEPANANPATVLSQSNPKFQASHPLSENQFNGQPNSTGGKKNITSGTTNTAVGAAGELGT